MPERRLVHSAAVACATMLLSGCVTAQGKAEPPPAVGECTRQTSTVTDYPTAHGPRQYRLVIPATASPDTPLIVALHGATGSMNQIHDAASFDQAAITLYPQSEGTPPATVWNAWPGSSDVTYVAGLIRDLHRAGCSAPSRTVITGFSMGAMVTSRLACSYPRLINGIGLVAGALPPTPGCRIPERMRVVVVHARDDDVVPFGGALSANLQYLAGGPAASTPGTTRVQIAKLWARAKGCSPIRTNRFSPTAARPDTTVRYTCPGSTPTVAAVYEQPTGHAWLPGSAPGGTTALLQRLLLPDTLPPTHHSTTPPATTQKGHQQ